MARDGKGQEYFDVGDVRITIKANTWKGCSGISIRAYREDGQLHQGAEIPIQNSKDAWEFTSKVVEAMTHLPLVSKAGESFEALQDSLETGMQPVMERK